MRCNIYKYDVFISVSEPDKKQAEELAEQLREHNIICYLFTEEPIISEDLLLELHKTIRRSRNVLILHSEIRRNRHWPYVEILLARVAGKKLITVSLDLTPPDNNITAYIEWHSAEHCASEINRKLEPQRKRDRKICFFLMLLLATAVTVTIIKIICITRCGSSKYVLIKGMAARNGKPERSFYISRTEVTIRQFEQYCADTGDTFPTPSPGSDLRPVTGITWKQALNYCRYVKGRLPEMDEWEYAARGGKDYAYSGSNTAYDVAVYGKHYSNPGIVRNKDCNGFGLFDMTGNAAEWCAPSALSKDSLMPVRGGAYNYPINDLKVSFKKYLPANTAVPWVGFRVVWDVLPE